MKKKCNKVKYRTEVDAKIALAKVRWQDKPHRDSMEQRVYRCHICKKFHLTSKPLRSFS